MQQFEIENTFQNVFHLIINILRLRYRKHAAKRKTKSKRLTRLSGDENPRGTYRDTLQFVISKL